MAKTTSKTTEAGTALDIVQTERGVVTYCIVGTSPYICNRMSQKVWFELLAPKGRKTTAEKMSMMKHDPIKEFRDSPYTIKDDNAATYLAVLPTAFKGAMQTAALDTPGAKKAQIGRLVSVDWGMQPLFGIPKLCMHITRSADMNRTPDVRTRAILPEWACMLKITFTKPILRETSISNLLAAAGFQSGVGDWRQEKGSGSFGSFRIASINDPDFVRITTTMGRAAQLKAMKNPVCYDAETEEILAWFQQEVVQRGFQLHDGEVVPNSRKASPVAQAQEIIDRVEGTKSRGRPRKTQENVLDAVLSKHEKRLAGKAKGNGKAQTL